MSMNNADFEKLRAVTSALRTMVEGLEKLFQALGPPPHPLQEKSRDPRVNDPFDLLGSEPSYRCYLGRHKGCEPEGPDSGCTCSCGHQEPVCACGLDEHLDDGLLALPGLHRHAYGCPQWEPPQWAEDTRGPKTWCSHTAERHGPESGCTECRCLSPKGHQRRTV